jgi:hypothetical protein
MNLGYVHCFLRCPNSCAIPLPHPSLLEKDDHPHSMPKGTRPIIVVCPYCGLASAYYERDVFQQVFVDKPSLFQSGECHLVSADIECDQLGCEAPKVIHTVQGVATGTWTEKVVAKDWEFSDSARCGAGHKLRFDESRGIHWVGPADYPF